MKLILAGVLTLVASLLPDILVRESVGFLPPWWVWAKAVLLVIFTLYLWVCAREKSLGPYTLDPWHGLLSNGSGGFEGAKRRGINPTRRRTWL